MGSAQYDAELNALNQWVIELHRAGMPQGRRQRAPMPCLVPTQNAAYDSPGRDLGAVLDARAIVENMSPMTDGRLSVNYIIKDAAERAPTSFQPRRSIGYGVHHTHRTPSTMGHPSTLVQATLGHADLKTTPRAERPVT